MLQALYNFKAGDCIEFKDSRFSGRFCEVLSVELDLNPYNIDLGYTELKNLETGHINDVMNQFVAFDLKNGRAKIIDGDWFKILNCEDK